MVRAKFQLVQIMSHYWSATGKTLLFQPSYDSTIEEDKKFALATPSGSFQMFCDNPSALAQFELGKFYYFDMNVVE